MERIAMQGRRKHGSRAQAVLKSPRARISLTFEAGSQSYLWTTERGCCRVVRK